MFPGPADQQKRPPMDFSFPPYFYIDSQSERMKIEMVRRDGTAPIVTIVTPNHPSPHFN